MIKLISWENKEAIPFKRKSGRRYNFVRFLLFNLYVSINIQVQTDYK